MTYSLAHHLRSLSVGDAAHEALLQAMEPDSGAPPSVTELAPPPADPPAPSAALADELDFAGAAVNLSPPHPLQQT